MQCSFPFYSNLSDVSEGTIYHTHPQCRIAQKIAVVYRISGIGDGRRECPFCFMLGEFQANRALRKHHLAGLSDAPLPGRQISASTASTVEKISQ